MASIDTLFGRALLAQGHKAVKEHFPEINLRAAAWVWCAGRNHWEFHGPSDFYWHGNAGNAFEARYKGWMAWLHHKGVDDPELEE